jgi:septal ring factor EnvC (AmiA/AmiB activator)
LIKHFFVALFFIAPVVLTAQKNIADLRGCLKFPVDSYIAIDSGQTELGWHGCQFAPSFFVSCSRKEIIKSVYTGNIASVFNVEGNYGVIIKYNEYYIVYGNLSEVFVKKGELVNEFSSIGTAGTSGSDDSEYGFEILLMKGFNYIPLNNWFNLNSDKKVFL